MRTFDLSPLYRNAIGFERMQRLLDDASTVNAAANSYPPYDIVALGEDQYRITLALAGHTPNDVDITVEQNRLTVASNAQKEAEKEVNYLHRGIAKRSFERRFELADHVKVTAANYVDGLLHIELVREIPKALKPRKVEINTASSTALETDQNAA